MSEKKCIHILVADDHPIVRQGLITLIEDWADMKVVGEASNGREAVNLFCQYRPDVTLLDLRMPEMDGIEALIAIREHCADARIILLTTYDSDEDIYHGLRAGAQAYLLKDTSREELIEAIRAVHAGQTRIPPPVAAKLARRRSGQELSQRELEVLRLLVAGKSNKEIEAELFISPSTVKTHIMHILEKLGVNDRTQAVTTALKRGLVRLE